MRVALLYEHPTWSTELIARAVHRAIDITPIDVADFDVAVPFHADTLGFDLWINRVNAMPSAGRPASIVAATGHLLTTLQLQGQKIINGPRTHRIGGSKIAQAALFASLGLATPATIGIYHPGAALAAAETLGYPVLTKPNVGGSGNGIVRHDTAAELRTAIADRAIDLGIDGTGVVQRVIESADGLIHRVEMLGSELFYGTQQALQVDAFNYCAADGCAIVGGQDAIQLFTPPAEIVQRAAAVLEAADTHVAGVEFIVDATTGEPSFYDFNPYSNFVSGYDDQLGFDPIERYLDFVLDSDRFAD